MENDPRKPNWTEYANLAANALQVSQLSAIRRELAYMQITAFDEQRRTAIEDQLRELAFQAEVILEGMKSAENENPAAALLLCHMVQNNLDAGNIVPASFRSFSDLAIWIERRERIHRIMRIDVPDPPR